MSSDNSSYVLDIERIIEFCFNDENKSSDSEITETYVVDDDDKNLVLATKQLREVKSGDASTKETMKYDFVKMLVTEFLNVDANNSPFSSKSIVFNTMLNEGFLKEIGE